MEIHLLDELGERAKSDAKSAPVDPEATEAPEEDCPDGGPSILGKDLLHGMLVMIEPDRNKPPELPGVPMLEKYGTSVAKWLVLPAQRCGGNGERQTRVELRRDRHGQTFVCFLTWENDQHEQWLMTPAHPAVLERAAVESTGTVIKSVVANADFLLAQERSKSNMLEVRTNITALNAMLGGQAEEIFENIIPDRLLELYGVPDVVDVEQPAATVEVHAHKVYAPGRFGVVGEGAAGLQELFRYSDQPLGPGRGYGFFGQPVCVAAACLDFDEDNLVSINSDDVYLSGAAAEVDRGDAVALGLQI